MGAETTQQLSELERKLLHALQYAFPLSERPYQQIAEQLQCSEELVLSQVTGLYEKGLIRRLGASINSRQLGYVSTLVALQVAAADIHEVARVVNKFPGVTHNYLREGAYNMWFTVIVPNQERLASVLEVIGATPGVQAIMPLPANRIFKVSVKFPLAAG